MANETGSGTLAGSAHQQSFDRLCAASARSISAAVNRQFCRPALAAAFPNQPPLVSFNLAPEKEDSRAASAQIIASLASAGFRPSPDTVAELMGFEVERVDIPSSPASFLNNSPAALAAESDFRQSSIVNRQSDEPDSDSDSDQPLSPSELAALQAFCRPLAADVLAADSPRFLSPLSAAVKNSEDKCESRDPAHCRFHGHPVQPSFRHAREGKSRSRSGSSKMKAASPESLKKSDPASALKIAHPVSSYKESRKLLSSFRKGYGLPGRGAVAPGMQQEFYVSQGSIDEMMAGKHVRKSADRISHFTAAANVQHLWELSRPLSKDKDRYNADSASDVKWVHKRVADLNIAGKLYHVKITAKEFKTNTPAILYSVQTMAQN